MDQQTYIISFEDVPPPDANRYAEELSNAVLDATTDAEVQRRRSDPYAQDFGSSLILILGTPAIVAVVNAIGNWLQLRRSASLTIKTPDGEVSAQNITSKDMERLMQIFLKKNEENAL